MDLLPLPSHLKKVLVAFSWQLRLATALAPSALDAMRHVSVPTLLVAKRGDALVPVQQSLEVMKACRGPACHVEVLESPHHSPAAIADSAQWERLLTQFLLSCNSIPSLQQ